VSGKRVERERELEGDGDRELEGDGDRELERERERESSKSRNMEMRDRDEKYGDERSRCESGEESSSKVVAASNGKGERCSCV